MSNKLKSVRDTSMQFKPAGIGYGDTRRLWDCGHRSHKGQKRGQFLWKCAKCVEGSNGR